MTDKSDPSARRRFLGVALGATTELLVGWRPPAASALGANDRVRIGVVGTGGRARDLMKKLRELPGQEVVAVSDVYEPRMLEAAEIAGGRPVKMPDYRRMLDDKGVHAVLIGAPDHWHKAMTLEAIAAGKDVYVEKPVSHSIEEGVAMVAAVEASPQVVQTGTQQRSWDHWILGKQIVDSGKLGRVTFVNTYWYQLRSTQPLPDVDAARLDWKRWLGSARDQPFDAERFLRWRHFKDFGGGVLTDLLGPLVHGSGHAADRDGYRAQLPHEDVGMARCGDGHSRISEGLHGHAYRDLRQQHRRRRPRVPRRPGHAQDRPGASPRIQ
ncbi:MAG: hypothetical protein DMF80_04775 [Acidobacteria bacterium]|nr:MAG: hypothetical protein DMF80_04775 [Acidobacteriota bacterium]